MLSTTSLQIESLLSCAGIEDSPINIAPLSHGANNRIYRIDFLRRAPIALKEYKNDQRDRLTREYAFSSFAWTHGVSCIPQPLAVCKEKNLGLYGFVQGRALQSHELQEGHLKSALDFFLEVNRYKSAAKTLPPASECCLSFFDYFQSVEKRFASLLSMEIKEAIDREAYEFVSTSLSSAWERVKSHALKIIEAEQLPLDEQLSPENQCVSPSDFGFHNAVMHPSGQMFFMDFEYAGRDDPAKLLSDFFCQPATPAPLSYFEHFAKQIAFQVQDQELFLRRAEIVFPICKIKWCCIMLNAFLQQKGREKKESQLQKTETYFKNISS